MRWVSSLVAAYIVSWLWNSTPVGLGASTDLIPSNIRGISSSLSDSRLAQNALFLERPNNQNPSGSVNPIDLDPTDTPTPSTPSASSPFSARCKVRPGAPPTSLAPATGTAVTATSMSFGWALVPCATDYRLVVKRSSKTGPTVFNGLVATPPTLSRLLNNTVYYWRVQAHNSLGVSAWSGWMRFTVSTFRRA